MRVDTIDGNQARRRLYLIGNAHIDPVWLWRWQEGFQEVRATFYAALQLMREYPDFIFTSSSAAFYAWIEESDPEMFAEIRQRVQEGRWAIVGGWWIQPDCNLPGGESFVRQGLYGQRYFQEKFGVTARVGYNVDSFGHHAMLPQILKKSGMDAYIFLRPMPHEKGLPGRLFWWEADDGSRVLGYRIPYEYCTWGKDLDAHVARCADEIKMPVPGGMSFYGVGNHGGGPTRENLESLLRLRVEREELDLVFGAPQDFFDAARQDTGRYPVIHDELQHHASGCYAAHSEIKRLNRQAENLLLAAEKFSSAAAQAVGSPDPLELERAWKNVLFNQFHDILAGTSLESAYEDARNEYGEALAIGGRALNRALQALAWNIRIDLEEGSRPFVVFNSHGWPARVPVEVETATIEPGEALLGPGGRPIPYQLMQTEAQAKGRSRMVFLADLPPLGYSLFRLARREGAPALADLPTGEHWIANDRFRLEFDPSGGWIRSLRDLKNQVEVFCGPAALPVVYHDPSDTWGHNVFRFDEQAGQFRAESVNLAACGPVKATMRVVSKYNNSYLIQEFSLYQDLDWIDVRATLDWREHFKLLKLRFPLNLNFMRPVSEIPYGAIERFASGDEEPGQSWLDVSGITRDGGTPYGLSLMNDGKYSYDVLIREIGLTISRSPVYANHMPVVPDPKEQHAFIDQGIQHFTYRLLPHLGSWETAGTVRRAAELNQPAPILPATFHPGNLPESMSFLCAEPGNIVVTVLKRAEEGGGWILRAVETAKIPTDAAIQLPGWERTITTRFGASEIKTFWIPQDRSQPVKETNLLEWGEG